MGLFAPKSNGLGLSGPAKGDRTEAYIAARFVAEGYTVLVPMGNRYRYDLVIEDATGQFWRIQCKTGRFRRGCMEFNVYSILRGYGGKESHTPYTGQVDYFAVYCEQLKKAYLVPATQAGTTSIALRVDPLPSRINEKRVKWAADYEL